MPPSVATSRHRGRNYEIRSAGKDEEHRVGRHWPAFNLADAAIVCGAAILVLEHVMALPDDREGQRELR
ncbi:signal peptidase II [Parvibaculum indicum]|uniref:signal peptidase II n=1 Tax=Parvibaculum indicum TaxID=562969 RepID=UPI003CCCE75E